MKTEIVIIGGGSHAKVLISIVKKPYKFKILGYTDINNMGLVLGVEYLGSDEILDEI